jgi:hypothetical protein
LSVNRANVVWSAKRRHSAIIVRNFGPAAYLRCCIAILLGKRTTFLNCVFQPET